ncbi:9150_t:CDS:2, partial [Paraglomus brasilianum]
WHLQTLEECYMLGLMIPATRTGRSSQNAAVREEFKYVKPDSISEDYFCPICHEVFDSVKRTRRSPCQECELQNASKTQNELDCLEVFCPYSPECEWQGTRAELRYHLQVDCQYAPVNCNEHEDHPDCKEVLPRKNIEKHRQECAYKMIGCPLRCLKKFYSSERAEAHCRDECINRETECVLCNQKFLFHQLNDHDYVCHRKVITCPHRNIFGSFGGCNEQFERRNLAAHLNGCKFEEFKEVFRAINLHMMTLERKIELLQRGYKEELIALSTLKLHAIDVKSSEQLCTILKYNPAVRCLHLVDFQPGYSWQLLTEVIASSETIVTLNLQGSEIEKVGAVLLSKALRNNTTVQSLNLTENEIGDQGIEFICKCLEVNKTLRHLDLSGNMITDKGAELLSRALEVNFTLESLDLSWNHIRSKGMETLSTALSGPQSNLQNLDLSHNDFGYKGVEYLATSLETNKSLINLNINHCKLGNKGIESLAKALEKNTSLQKLILSGNSIDDHGVESLSNGLLLNTSLQVLNLDDNVIGDIGAEYVIKAMDKAAVAFTQSTGFNDITRTLFFRRNQISRNGLRIATKGMKFVHVITDRGEW